MDPNVEYIAKSIENFSELDELCVDLAKYENEAESKVLWDYNNDGKNTLANIRMGETKNIYINTNLLNAIKHIPITNVFFYETEYEHMILRTSSLKDKEELELICAMFSCV